MERELILSVQRGKEAAFSELCEQYAPLIDSIVSRYGSRLKDSGENKEDLRQEAILSFYRAIMTYDTAQTKVTFGLYAKICMRNRMVSLLRKTQKQNKQTSKRETLSPLGNAAPSVRSNELQTLADQWLTAYEKTVFFLYIDGKSYRDIAISLGVTVKSVDNALFRAKTKLRHGYRM